MLFFVCENDRFPFQLCPAGSLSGSGGPGSPFLVVKVHTPDKGRSLRKGNRLGNN